jgi:hypothetical protein
VPLDEAAIVPHTVFSGALFPPELELEEDELLEDEELDELEEELSQSAGQLVAFSPVPGVHTPSSLHCAPPLSPEPSPSPETVPQERQKLKRPIEITYLRVFMGPQYASKVAS